MRKPASPYALEKVRNLIKFVKEVSIAGKTPSVANSPYASSKRIRLLPDIHDVKWLISSELQLVPIGLSGFAR